VNVRTITFQSDGDKELSSESRVKKIGIERNQKHKVPEKLGSNISAAFVSQMYKNNLNSFLPHVTTKIWKFICSSKNDNNNNYRDKYIKFFYY
jgi:hypothetical protein